MENDRPVLSIFPNLGSISDPVRGTAWIKSAREISAHLAEESLVVLSPTSSGKTVLLLAIARGIRIGERAGRTVIVVPTRQLTENHDALHRFMFEKETKIITGDTSPGRRLWFENEVVLTTADTLLSEILRGCISLNDFDLVGMDECHHMLQGEHSYAKLGRMIAETGVRWMGLTPVIRTQKIGKFEELFGIRRILRPEIPTPQNVFVVRTGKRNGSYDEIEKLIDEMMADSERNLNTELYAMGCSQSFNRNETKFTELEAIGTEIRGLPKSNPRVFAFRNKAMSFWAMCMKLWTLRDQLLNQSYIAYRDSLQKLGKDKRVHANQWIVTHKNSTRILELIKSEPHPKSVLIKEVASRIRDFDEIGLAGVHGYSSCDFLAANVASKMGIPTGTFHADQKSDERMAALQKLGDRDVTLLFCTISSLGEGRTTPGLDNVVFADFPRTIEDVVQFGGRTGRGVLGGSIWLLVSPVQSERGAHWALRNQLYEWQRVNGYKKSRFYGLESESVPRSDNPQILLPFMYDWLFED